MFSQKQKPDDNAEPPVPPAFAAAFWRLVRRMTVPGGRLDPGTVRDYWTALQDVPMDRLAAGADDLVRHQVFFPAVAEWRQAASSRPATRVDWNGCAQCGHTGLIKICYQSGELFDIAICTCRIGQAYRRGGDELVRRRFALQDSQQVAFLEDVLAAHDAEEAGHIESTPDST
jgi:hypothetical protein